MPVLRHDVVVVEHVSPRHVMQEEAGGLRLGGTQAQDHAPGGSQSLPILLSEATRHARSRNGENDATHPTTTHISGTRRVDSSPTSTALPPSHGVVPRVAVPRSQRVDHCEFQLLQSTAGTSRKIQPPISFGTPPPLRQCVTAYVRACKSL